MLGADKFLEQRLSLSQFLAQLSSEPIPGSIAETEWVQFHIHIHIHPQSRPLITAYEQAAYCMVWFANLLSALCLGRCLQALGVLWGAGVVLCNASLFTGHTQ